MMMPSEILAEKLYEAYVESAKPIHPILSAPPRWLDLGREGRSRWREVANVALVFTAPPLEDWHGQTTHTAD